MSRLVGFAPFIFSSILEPVSDIRAQGLADFVAATVADQRVLTASGLATSGNGDLSLALGTTIAAMILAALPLLILTILPCYMWALVSAARNSRWGWFVSTLLFALPCYIYLLIYSKVFRIFSLSAPALLFLLMVCYKNYQQWAASAAAVLNRIAGTASQSQLFHQSTNSFNEPTAPQSFNDEQDVDTARNNQEIIDLRQQIAERERVLEAVRMIELGQRQPTNAFVQSSVSEAALGSSREQETSKPRYPSMQRTTGALLRDFSAEPGRQALEKLAAGPIGKYKQAVNEAVQASYYSHISPRMDMLNVGTLELSYFVNPDGGIDNLRVISNTSNESFEIITTEALRAASIPPMPQDVSRVLNGGRLEMNTSFSIINQ